MLKLTKRRRSPNFYARGTFLKVAVDQSLGTGDRRQAEALLARLQTKSSSGKRVVPSGPRKNSPPPR